MQTISEDTQAVLLLCGVFSGAPAGEEAPLGPSEFHRLARWLEKESATPASLLDTLDSARVAEGIAEHQIAAERIERLLKRGMTVAVATERWLQMGLWILSVADDAFPARLKKKLRDKVMPLLFGIGDPGLLDGGGLAVVGSRKADEAAQEFARKAGELCARNGMPVISGAARGIDMAAMQGALDAGGAAVGVLGSDLARQAVSPETRVYLQAGNLTLVTPFSPEAPFHAGNAMARNKYIYALADRGLVVSSEAETGGTWSGATENLKQQWTPLWVRRDANAPRGNELLIRRGARALETSWLSKDASFQDLFRDDGDSGELTLFDE
ncbi:DNA-processing protein DprA [bacterium]|nr:DNA-processing protein DprA [bacterium]MBU1984784.1 DNA-processing protein DprA [bacterium]